jgi:hypothetical protein
MKAWNLVCIGVLALVASGAALRFPEDYGCAVCEQTVAAAQALGNTSIESSCLELPGTCAFLRPKLEGIEVDFTRQSALEICQEAEMCPRRMWEHDTLNPTNATPDIRVTRGMGPLGYNRMRLSVISNASGRGKLALCACEMEKRFSAGEGLSPHPGIRL